MKPLPVDWITVKNRQTYLDGVDLKVLKENSPNKSTAGHLNFNSIRSKCEVLEKVIDRNPDILLSESKVNDLFPPTHFTLKW